MDKSIFRLFTTLCLLYCPTCMIAQVTFQDSYSAFKQQAQDMYEDFRQQANKEYASWMRQAWEWHQQIEPMLIPKEEKVPPIIYNKNQERAEPKPMPYDGISPSPQPQPQPKPIAPIHENDADYDIIMFQFYGTTGSVRIPKKELLKLDGNDEETYAKAWEILSSEQYDNLIRDCLIIRMEHQLCDWAYLMMLKAMSEKVYGGSNNEARLLQAYVLCQSGYKMRLGFTESHDLRLLFKSEHVIFSLPGFEMEDGLFYLTEKVDNINGLYVCDLSFPEEKPLSLWITHEQLFDECLSNNRILIPEDSLVKTNIQVNKNLIDFYNEYPTSFFGNDMMTRWAIYANAPLAGKVKTLLFPQLKKILQSADVLTAANWLLYYVQTAFVYEYDDKVWGVDRAFFAEETLYYPYCDCEDRSILFSRLIRDLLGLKVVLVYYPGHLATAVKFENPVQGDHLDINGQRFTICDPTYIGAPVGVTMPEMDNKNAKVILLD